jgi:hypothetical protein
MPSLTIDRMARIRLAFDVSDRVRRAMNAAAGQRDLSLGQLLEEMVEKYLPEALAFADKAPDSQSAPKSSRKPKRSNE